MEIYYVLIALASVLLFPLFIALSFVLIIMLISLFLAPIISLDTVIGEVFGVPQNDFSSTELQLLWAGPVFVLSALLYLLIS